MRKVISTGKMISSVSESSKVEKVALRSIIDTWNMVEKYNIDYEQDEKGNVLISKEDFDKLLNNSKNKKYINNLRVGVGSTVYGRRNFSL